MEQMKKYTWKVWIATGFGLGNAPIASGTWGTLPGIPLAYLIFTYLPNLWMQIAACAALVLIAIPICDCCEPFFGKKDDGRIVADEYMIFPLCMIGLPFTPATLIMAFLVARVCDIIKPPPARNLERLSNGLGIVIDDFFATLYALGINHLLFYAVTRYTDFSFIAWTFSFSF